jgi:hypothetical protein
MLAVVHFLTNDEWPYELVGAFKAGMAPSRCLALSHITDDQVDEDVSNEAQKIYNQASAPVIPRSRDEILGFFSGLTLVGPGPVDINIWPERQSSDVRKYLQDDVAVPDVGP